MKTFFKVLAIILAAVCLLATVKLAFEALGSQKKKYITIDR